MSYVVTPNLIDLILVGVALEFLLLAVWLSRRSAAPWIWPLFLYLGSGAALMIALRSALTDAEPRWIALPLATSFFAHGGSLFAVLRLRTAEEA